MTLHELQQTIKYIRQNCRCPKCQSKYQIADIQVVATNDSEGVFELDCPKCDCLILMNLFVSADKQEIIEDVIDQAFTSPDSHGGIKRIDHNDILDIKNFLAKFDGNFKKVIKQNNK
ncbi:hypothetical protein CVV38_04370 [Candidatus Peregrinibacteria bacterium HGW-Peregrinibacteria-1]|jgi:hypothetical protein|nr:MAG: hypothetical protein CVV38_04370 [Candidatus Peregrinibacteria bacterium HGW-Peregrinibacteria-1]